MMDIFDKIAGIIERVTGTPKASITRATTLADISAEPFDQYEMLIEIDLDFDVDLSDDMTENCRHIGDIADLVEKLVKARAVA